MKLFMNQITHTLETVCHSTMMAHSMCFIREMRGIHVPLNLLNGLWRRQKDFVHYEDKRSRN